MVLLIQGVSAGPPWGSQRPRLGVVGKMGQRGEWREVEPPGTRDEEGMEDHGLPFAAPLICHDVRGGWVA